MADRIRLDGKVAVVTGAAGVIGTATIKLLAARGARIVAVDRNAGQLEAAIKDLPASAEAFAITADVTQEDEVAGYVRAAMEKFGAVDVFYNNAGIEGEITPIVRYPLETFRRVLEVNVVAVFLGLKHVLPVMLQQNRGSIINTASIAGLIGSPDIAPYTASKHAVIGLTKVAAIECTNTAVRVELRLSRPDRQPDAERDRRGPQHRQCAGADRQGRRPRPGAPARPCERGRLGGGISRVR